MPHAVRVAATLVALGLASCATTPEPTQSAAHSAGSSASDPAWSILPDAPLARLEMATTAHGGRIWLAGGLSPLGEAVNEVETYDPESGEWLSGPALPTGVHHAALVSDGERIMLIGGYLGASFNQPTEIVLTLADGADAWEPGPPLPDPRAAGAAAWDGARIVYAGGVGRGGVSSDVFALADGIWGLVGAMPNAREHLAATSDGEGRTWLLGGRVGGLDTNLADIDLVEGASITAQPPLPTRRGGVAAFFLPALGACLTGGESPDRAHAEVECVDESGAVSAAPRMNVPRHGHGAAVIGSSAYLVLGGPTPALSAHASVERLDLGR